MTGFISFVHEVVMHKRCHDLYVQILVQDTRVVASDRSAFDEGHLDLAFQCRKHAWCSLSLSSACCLRDQHAMRLARRLRVCWHKLPAIVDLKLSSSCCQSHHASLSNGECNPTRTAGWECSCASLSMPIVSVVDIRSWWVLMERPSCRERRL